MKQYGMDNTLKYLDFFEETLISFVSRNLIILEAVGLIMGITILFFMGL
jgi:hypothetical protein